MSPTLAPTGRNLELKARHPDLAAAREAVGRLGAHAAGVEVQTDTYFPVPAGRLKLREIDGVGAVLIWYDRADQNQARPCDYRLTLVSDSERMKEILAAALGLRGQVRKRREIYFWHNVRIHLDEVEGLGRFLELEAVIAAPEEESASQARLDELCQTLGIQPGDILAASNADLLGL